MDERFPFVDIITVNYNGVRYLPDFFSSLGRLDYPKDKMRLIFVDNASQDGSLEFVRKLKPDFNLHVIANRRNYGFAKAHNLVFPECRQEYVALLNNDTKVDKGWLASLIAKIRSDPQIGIVSSRQLPQESCRPIDPETGETSWCSGGHCVIRRRALEAVGYFDEKFFMYGEDVDVSWRMWLKGYACLYVPEALCHHHYDDTSLYTRRRIFFHVRNSILLWYVYGTGREVFYSIMRWSREAGSLFFKRGKFADGAVVLASLICHVFLIPHFLARRQDVHHSPDFQIIKTRWIRQ
jgi:GT2 family glycosyltransferase